MNPPTGNDIAHFLVTNWGTIALFLGGLWTLVKRIDPILARIPIAGFVTNLVNAMQQTVSSPSQRLADADAALAKKYPHLTEDERRLWIEAKVALSKVGSGVSFDQLPPADTTPAPDYQALFTQALQDAAPQIEALIEAKVAASKAEPRTAGGQFVAGSAPVVVSSAAHVDPSSAPTPQAPGA